MSEDVKDLQIVFERATKDEIAALALYLKRVTFDDARSHAASEDEAYMMLNGIEKLQTALGEVGYNPR